MPLSHNHQWKRKRLFWSIFLLLIILVCTGCRLMSDGYCIPVLQYALPLLSIIMAWMLVSLPERVVNHRGLLITFFLLMLCFGIYVYSGQIKNPDSNPVASVLYPINNSLSLFFPSRGDSPEPDKLDTYTWAYYLLHYLSYFFFAWVGFSLFGRKLLNRTSLSFIRYNHRNLIWGYSDGGLELAKDMLNVTEDEEPVFIINDDIQFEAEREKKILNKLSDENILAISVNFDKLSTDARDYSSSYISWRRLMRTGKYFGGHRHFFITEDQDHNVKMAFLILDQLKLNIRHIKYKTHLYVRTEQPGIDSFFQQEMDSCAELSQKVEIHLFNQSDLTARRFAEHNPILKLAEYPDLLNGGKAITIDHEHCEVNGEINVLILGLGWTGFELLNKTVCDAAFANRFKLNITVIDNDYTHKHGRYQTIVDEARKHGVNICINPRVWLNADHQIELQSLDEGTHTVGGHLHEDYVHTVNSVLFYRWLTLDNNILRFNRIIVALGSDELNINTALDLHRFRLGFLDATSANDPTKMPEPIFAHVRDKESYKYYKDKQTPINTFGSMTNIYTFNVLVNEVMDTIAKMVNYTYSRYDTVTLTEEDLRQGFISGDVEKAWNSGSLFDQDSSRAVAMNIQNVIDIAGGDQAFARKLSNPGLIDKLGELEHLRWNAFHFMRGIKPWAFNEVVPVKIDGKLKTNGKLMFGAGKILVRHICLVPFSSLDKASETINRLDDNNNENYKATDRRIIRHFLMFKQYKELTAR